MNERASECTRTGNYPSGLVFFASISKSYKFRIELWTFLHFGPQCTMDSPLGHFFRDSLEKGNPGKNENHDT